MSKITVKNLSSKSAFQILSNFQNNFATSFSIQGEKECRYINTHQILATMRLIDRETREYSFELVSNYYSQENLENFFESDFTASL